MGKGEESGKGDARGGDVVRRITHLLLERQESLCSMIPFGLSGSSDSSVTYAKVKSFQYFSISDFVTTDDRLLNFYYFFSLNRFTASYNIICTYPITT